MTTHTLLYGTLTTGKPYRSYSTDYNTHIPHYWRDDVYIPNDNPTKPVTETISAAYPNDDTPPHSGQNYDFNCSSCWLNIPHTEALHTQSLQR